MLNIDEIDDFDGVFEKQPPELTSYLTRHDDDDDDAPMDDIDIEEMMYDSVVQVYCC